ncbi:hypothetical protein B0H19DRAFT_1373257 [Mycena capillaripes]|nr:hypothetical protein B0H19DRAFT_1373257 [Mycena capillaripes]
MADSPNPPLSSRPKIALSSNDEFLLPNSSQVLPPSSPAPAAISDQKGLSKSQSVGIKAVEHILLSNNGGISLETPAVSSTSSQPRPAADPVPMGPASNTRAIARSTTLPEGILPPGAPAKAAEQSSTPVVAPVPMVEHPPALSISTYAVANLTTEMRLNARQLVEPSSPPTTWKGLYGLDLPKSRAPSESSDSDNNSDAVRGRLEELESEAAANLANLVARVSALEEHTAPSAPPNASDITAPQLHNRVVTRFNAVQNDLRMLNDEIYAQGQEHANTIARLSEKITGLQEAKKSLRDDNITLRRDFKTIQAAIARLELAPPAPLQLRSRSPLSTSFHLPHGHGHTSQRRSRSPPLQYPQTRVNPRPRSFSPPMHPAEKRQRANEPNGYIALGPVGDSAETLTRFFELHLRTAIPRFILEAPYQVQADPAFRAHLRVAVTSRAVARSLVEAWAKNTVAGYVNIKMVQMDDATGNQAIRNDNNSSMRGDVPRNRDVRDNASRGSFNQGQRRSEPTRR